LKTGKSSGLEWEEGQAAAEQLCHIPSVGVDTENSAASGSTEQDDVSQQGKALWGESVSVGAAIESIGISTAQ